MPSLHHLRPSPIKAPGYPNIVLPLHAIFLNGSKILFEEWIFAGLVIYIFISHGKLSLA